MPWLYPEFYLFGEVFVLVFQTMLIVGGIVTTLGAILYAVNVSASRIVIIIGALMGGINIVALWGVKLMSDDHIQVREIKNLSLQIGGNTLEDKIKWAKNQFREGSSMRDIAYTLREPLVSVKQYIESDLDEED